jgi:hypothetical protein
MNRRDVIKGAAAIAAAAALPELEDDSYLGDFTDPSTYFSNPRPPCEIAQLPRELLEFVGLDPPGGVA